MARAGVIGIYKITIFTIWNGSTISRRNDKQSSRKPSAFLRDQNPAASVVEVISFANSKLNGGVLWHNARFLVPEGDRRLP
jgi:hypothetical protein